MNFLLYLLIPPILYGTFRILLWAIDLEDGALSVTIAIIVGLVGTGLCFIIGFYPFYAVKKNEPYIFLNKNDWVCTDTRTETIMMPMLVGKITVMTPQVHTVCTQYTRKR